MQTTNNAGTYETQQPFGGEAVHIKNIAEMEIDQRNGHQEEKSQDESLARKVVQISEIDTENGKSILEERKSIQLEREAMQREREAIENERKGIQLGLDLVSKQKEHILQTEKDILLLKESLDKGLKESQQAKNSALEEKNVLEKERLGLEEDRNRLAVNKEVLEREQQKFREEQEEHTKAKTLLSAEKQRIETERNSLELDKAEFQKIVALMREERTFLEKEKEKLATGKTLLTSFAAAQDKDNPLHASLEKLFEEYEQIEQEKRRLAAEMEALQTLRIQIEKNPEERYKLVDQVNKEEIEQFLESIRKEKEEMQILKRNVEREKVLIEIEREKLAADRRESEEAERRKLFDREWTKPEDGRKRTRKRKEREGEDIGEQGRTPESGDGRKKRCRKPWEERFEELKRYKEKSGHFSLPSSPEFASLKIWMANQKALQAKGKLERDRADKLSSIGFPWWQQKRESWDGNTSLDLDKSSDQVPQKGSGRTSSGTSRTQELVAFFGAEVTAHSDIMQRFARQGSEHIVDNAVKWLDNDFQSFEKELIKGLEKTVNLGKEPLNYLLRNEGFRVTAVTGGNMEWIAEHYESIQRAFDIKTASKKILGGKWSLPLVFHELRKVYLNYLGLSIAKKGQKISWYQEVGKTCGEYWYGIDRSEYASWGCAVYLRAKVLGKQQVMAYLINLPYSQKIDDFGRPKNQASGAYDAEELRERIEEFRDKILSDKKVVGDSPLSSPVRLTIDESREEREFEHPETIIIKNPGDNAADIDSSSTVRVSIEELQEEFAMNSHNIPILPDFRTPVLGDGESNKQTSDAVLPLQDTILRKCSAQGCANHETPETTFQVCLDCREKGRRVPYCGRQCQAKDWFARHMNICGTPLTAEEQQLEAAQIQESKDNNDNDNNDNDNNDNDNNAMQT